MVLYRNKGTLTLLPSSYCLIWIFTNSPSRFISLWVTPTWPSRTLLDYKSCAKHTSGLYKPCYTSHNEHTPGPYKLCRAHPKCIQVVLSTTLVYTSRLKHTPDLCKSCLNTTHVYRSIPQVYKSRVEHSPCLYKPYQAHPRSIQAVPEDTSGIHKSCQAHHRSIQAMLSILLIYTRTSYVYTGRTGYGVYRPDMFGTVCIDLRCTHHDLYRLGLCFYRVGLYSARLVSYKPVVCSRTTCIDQGCA